MNMKNGTKSKMPAKAAARRKAKMSVAAVAIIAVLLTTTFSSVASARPSGLIALQEALPIVPGTWLGIAFLLVLILMAIAAAVYMLSSILDYPGARTWARLQIYEGVLTIALLLIFLAFAYIFFLNPVPALQSVHLIDTSNPIYSCAAATDIFTAGTCNLAVFNDFSYAVFEATFYAAIYLSFVTGIRWTLTFGGATNAQIQAGAGLDSLVPVSVDSSISVIFSAMLTLFFLNQLQLLILAGSLFWFSFFVTLGLVARAFGVTRTFGGAMIALGVGLGLVYPIVVTITYGFLNFQVGTSGFTGDQLLNDIFTSMLALVACPATQSLGGSCLPSGQWVFQLAVAIAGLTFIPFLNFTIVDAFIVDFSRAIGERLDFMSLLAGMI